jgi:hypothetical protein
VDTERKTPREAGRGKCFLKVEIIYSMLAERDPYFQDL